MSPRPRASTSTALRILEDSLLFAELDKRSLRFIADAAVVNELAEGDVVFGEGARAKSFHVLDAGFVKVVRALPDGHEDLVSIVGPRESLGDAAVLERRIHRATAIVASERAVVLRVDAAVVRGRLEHDPAFAAASGRVVLAHTRKLHEKIRILSAGSVPQRIATLLLVRADRFGEPEGAGFRRIPLPLTRGEIATFIGARVETTIRCIRVWERDGVLETTGRGIVVRDQATLRAAERGC